MTRENKMEREQLLRLEACKDSGMSTSRGPIL